jgi:hypothetical protein
MLNGPKIHMETLLYGKVEHLHHHLKEKLKAKEDNDLIFTISAVDTPENPEDALVLRLPKIYRLIFTYMDLSTTRL